MFVFILHHITSVAVVDLYYVPLYFRLRAFVVICQLFGIALEALVGFLSLVSSRFVTIHCIYFWCSQWLQKNLELVKC